MNKNFGEKLLADKPARSAWCLVLTKIDADLAAQACALGCLLCGGALHRANYPRKPRGMDVEAFRDSFCCAVDGCRRRLTPASVRFLGRRVYPGFIVVLLAALQHGLSAARVSVLQEQLGVDRRTLERWREWWLHQFPSGRLWRAARAHLLPPVNAAALPWSLWERFTGHGADSLLALLRFLTPWSIPTAPAK